jgi:hypothetical protein
MLSEQVAQKPKAAMVSRFRSGQLSIKLSATDHWGEQFCQTGQSRSISGTMASQTGAGVV